MNILDLQNLIFEKQKQFDTYYQELLSYNDKVNLTAILDKTDAYTKHFLDSILAIDEIPMNASLVDIGTGAGFPSLPIKIVRPDIKITMVDSLNKRVTFLNHICSKLKIKSENVHARAEDFAKTKRESFDVGVARAVAKLNTLCEYILPLVKVGGIMIAYKAGNIQEELQMSENAIKTLGGEVEKLINITLPNDYGERTLVIIRKVRPTDKKYPRGKNLPKLEPIM